MAWEGSTTTKGEKSGHDSYESDMVVGTSLGEAETREEMEQQWAMD